MRAAEPGPREQAWLQELTEDAPVAAAAALRLGRLKIATGEAAEGRRLLCRAIGSADPGIAPQASLALAEDLFEAGRCEEATAEFSRAAAIASVSASPDVVLALASRFAVHGQIDAAITSYRLFLDEATDDQRELAAIAAYRLGELLLDQGALIRGVRLLRKSIRDGSRGLAVHARSALADLYALWGKQERPAFEKTILTCLLQGGEGLLEAAETEYQRVVESEHSHLAPRAAYYLAKLRERAGDMIAAEEGLRSVVLSGHPEYAELAQGRLERVELDTGAAVEELLERLFRPDRQLELDDYVDDYREYLLPTLCAPESRQALTRGCDHERFHSPDLSVAVTINSDSMGGPLWLPVRPVRGRIAWPLLMTLCPQLWEPIDVWLRPAVVEARPYVIDSITRSMAALAAVRSSGVYHELEPVRVTIEDLNVKGLAPAGEGSWSRRSMLVDGC